MDSLESLLDRMVAYDLTQGTSGPWRVTRIVPEFFAVKGRQPGINIYYARQKWKPVQHVDTPHPLARCYPGERLRQVTGTCYFNASHNALLLGHLLQHIVKGRLVTIINALKPALRNHIVQDPLDTVHPPDSNWVFVLQVFYEHFFSDDSLFNTSFRVSGKAAQFNLPSAMVYSYSFKHRKKETNSQGGYPLMVLQEMLTRFGITWGMGRRGPPPRRGPPDVLLVWRPSIKSIPVESFGVYRLDTCFIVTADHVMLGLLCFTKEADRKGVPVVYDTGHDRLFPIDWRLPASLHRVRDYYGPVVEVLDIYVNVPVARAYEKINPEQIPPQTTQKRTWFQMLMGT